jgi:predicted transcriptional regulator
MTTDFGMEYAVWMESPLMADTDNTDLAQLTVQLLSSYLSNNIVPREDLPELIKATRAALSDDALASTAPEPEYSPAVSVRKSLASPDHILSLIDGKPYKMLKRHLAQHGLTPAQYRERYHLPPDYPMTAKAYSDERRATAARIGLGGRRSLAATTPVPSAEEAAADADAAVTEEMPSPAPSSSPATDGKSATTAETSTGPKRDKRKSKTLVKAASTKKSGVTTPRRQKVAREALAVSPAKIGSEKKQQRSESKKFDETLTAARPVEGDATSLDVSPLAPSMELARPARKKPALETDAAKSESKRRSRKREAEGAQTTDQKAEPVATAKPAAPQSVSPSPARATKKAPAKGRGKTTSAPPATDEEKAVSADGQPTKQARNTLRIKAGA